MERVLAHASEVTECLMYTPLSGTPLINTLNLVANCFSCLPLVPVFVPLLLVNSMAHCTLSCTGISLSLGCLIIRQLLCDVRSPNTARDNEGVCNDTKFVCLGIIHLVRPT